jgi:hypothetical protein
MDAYLRSVLVGATDRALHNQIERADQNYNEPGRRVAEILYGVLAVPAAIFALPHQRSAGGSNLTGSGQTKNQRGCSDGLAQARLC